MRTLRGLWPAKIYKPCADTSSHLESAVCVLPAHSSSSWSAHTRACTISMASVVHAASPTYPPPPSFSQNSTESSMNSIYPSHSALNSFDGPQSVASTPTPTPPASRHQNIMPYNTSTYGQINGNHSQQSTPRHYHDLKPSVQQQQYPSGQKPQIYTVRLPHT